MDLLIEPWKRGDVAKCSRETVAYRLAETPTERLKRESIACLNPVIRVQISLEPYFIVNQMVGAVNFVDKTLFTIYKLKTVF